MKTMIAIDSMKGCLTSCEANRAAAEGILAARPEAEVAQIPVSDGGEGWLEAYRAAVGGETIALTVRDPLMKAHHGRLPCRGRYGCDRDGSGQRAHAALGRRA